MSNIQSARCYKWTRLLSYIPFNYTSSAYNCNVIADPSQHRPGSWTYLYLGLSLCLPSLPPLEEVCSISTYGVLIKCMLYQSSTGSGRRSGSNSMLFLETEKLTPLFFFFLCCWREYPLNKSTYMMLFRRIIFIYFNWETSLEGIYTIKHLWNQCKTLILIWGKWDLVNSEVWLWKILLNSTQISSSKVYLLIVF